MLPKVFLGRIKTPDFQELGIYKKTGVIFNRDVTVSAHEFPRENSVYNPLGIGGRKGHRG